jgi:class 3 adenylate cyclase
LRFAAFESGRFPDDGFALRLQARLRQWNQGKRVMCRSRIGINTGEVAVELDATGGVRDLKGIEVDKCSRVMSRGGPDQILLSGFVSGNARSHLDGLSLPEVGELSWVAHGAYPIKGFDEPVEICEVGESGHAPLVAPRVAARVRIWGGGILCALMGAIFLILPPLSPPSAASGRSSIRATAWRLGR